MGVLIFDSTAQASTERIPYTIKALYVGSVYVKVDVGYNDGVSAYAIVSAHDYVDVQMTMVVYYEKNGESYFETIPENVAQQTYVNISWRCDSIIKNVECYFDILSKDGDEHIYLGV